MLEILKCQLRWRLWRRSAKEESVAGLKYLVLERGNGLPIAECVRCGYTFRFWGRVMLGLLRFLSVFEAFGTGLGMDNCTIVV